MNRRQLFWLFLSLAGAGLLLAYLAAHTGLDLAGAMRLIVGLDAVSLAEITVLLGFNSYLAGEKWRLLDRLLGPDEQSGMTRTAYFAWTAVGVGLGQLLPAPLSLGLCRSLGSHLHQRGAMRGAGLTVFEQLFDVIAAGLLGLASAAVVVTASGSLGWVLCAVAAAVAGFAVCSATGSIPFAVCGLLRLAAALKLGLGAGERDRSRLLQPAVTRRLLALSLLRFAILVAIAATSAAAVPVEIPVWRLAAALPFAIIGNALAVTPGGLGVNEWAMSSALFAFGTPFATAAQWAIANRILVAVAALAGAGAGLFLMAIWHPRLHARAQPG